MYVTQYVVYHCLCMMMMASLGTDTSNYSQCIVAMVKQIMHFYLYKSYFFIIIWTTRHDFVVVVEIQRGGQSPAFRDRVLGRFIIIIIITSQGKSCVFHISPLLFFSKIGHFQANLICKQLPMFPICIYLNINFTSTNIFVYL